MKRGYLTGQANLTPEQERQKELLQLLDLLVKFRDDLKQEENDISHKNTYRENNEVSNVIPVRSDKTNEAWDDVEDNYPMFLSNPSFLSKYSSHEEPVSSMPLLLNLISPAEQPHRVKYTDRSDPLFTTTRGVYDADPFLERNLLSRPNDINKNDDDEEEQENERQLMLMNDLPRIPIQDGRQDDIDSEIVFQPEASVRENRVIPASVLEESLLLSQSSPETDMIPLDESLGISGSRVSLPESPWKASEGFSWGRLDDKPSSSQTSSFLDSILFPGNLLSQSEVELGKIYSMRSPLADEN